MQQKKQKKITSPEEIDFMIGDILFTLKGKTLPLAQDVGDDALGIPRQMILYGKGYTIIVHDADEFQP